MPDPRDDLVRRGDVLNALHKIPIVRLIDESEIKTGEEEMFAALPADQAIDRTEDAVQAIPADPVAAAALALAEAKSRPNVCFGTLHDGSARYEGFECSTCGHKWYPGGPVLWPREEWHHEACPAGKYRAALAGRERGR